MAVATSVALAVVGGWWWRWRPAEPMPPERLGAALTDETDIYLSPDEVGQWRLYDMSTIMAADDAFAAYYHARVGQHVGDNALHEQPLPLEETIMRWTSTFMPRNGYYLYESGRWADGPRGGRWLVVYLSPEDHAVFAERLTALEQLGRTP